jgi:5'-nucleotidase
MKILLTNDDGYRAQGLLQLATALSKFHEVHIVAPDSERSGAGHSVTFWRAINYKVIDTMSLTEGKLNVPCYALDGTPCDCTKFAIEHLYLGTTFDLVVSGINNCLNVGTDAIYSGTFNAAQEGTILGVKAVSLSTVDKDGDYSYPIRFFMENMDDIIARIRPMVTININIPSSKEEDIKGVRVVKGGHRTYNDHYVKKDDGFYTKGSPYDQSNSLTDDDCRAVDQGYIAITPVRAMPRDEDLLDDYANMEWKR